jgi:aminocarboxymuconate-semialdehyde decarboxylase
MQKCTQVVVDLHSHWLPTKYIELAERNEFGNLVEINNTAQGKVMVAGKLTLGQILSTPIDAKLTDLNVQFIDKDSDGIDITVISFQPFTFHYEGETKQVAEIHKMLNDELISVVKKYPNKAKGLANLPLQDVDLAIAELERIMEIPGMIGVQLGSNVNGKYLGEKEYAPFFEAAETSGAVVLIHPMNVAAHDRLNKFYFRNLIGNPLDSTICAASLIFEGTMERFPNLKICLCHAGGFIPFVYGRLDHGTRVRAENGALPKLPSYYLRNFYYDIVSHAPESLAYLIKLVGADRVVIGTDYPLDMGLQCPIDVIEGLSLTKNEREMILGGNVHELMQ